MRSPRRASEELLELLSRISLLGSVRDATHDLQLGTRKERSLPWVFVLLHYFHFSLPLKVDLCPRGECWASAIPLPEYPAVLHERGRVRVNNRVPKGSTRPRGSDAGKADQQGNSEPTRAKRIAPGANGWPFPVVRDPHSDNSSDHKFMSGDFQSRYANRQIDLDRSGSQNTHNTQNPPRH